MPTKTKVAPVGNPELPECSVSGPLRLVLRVSQFFGAGPLTFRKRGDEWTVSVSKRKTQLTYIFGVVMNVVTWVEFVKDLHGSDMYVLHPTRMLTWVLEYTVVMVTASIAVLGAPYRLRKTILCLRTIQKINKAGNKDKSENTKGKLVFVVWFLPTLIMILMNFADFVQVSAGMPRGPGILMLVAYYYGNVLLLLLQMQFVFSAVEVASTLAVLQDLVRDLDQKLDKHYASLDTMALGYSTKLIPNKSVNKIIDNMSTITVDQGFTVAPTLKSICGTIRRLVSMYEETCDVMKQLDGCHAAGVLLVLLCIFWHAIIMLYELITTRFVEGHVLKTTWQFFWLVNDFLCTVAIIEPGHRAQVEDNRVRLLVSRMVLKCPEAAVLGELEKFSRYLLANQPAYCPLGVCILTRPLVASIIGSVVTYMVIIVQFQLSE